MKKLFNGLTNTRVGYATLLMLLSVLLSALLGTAFVLIPIAVDVIRGTLDQAIGDLLLRAIWIMYLLFGAPISVSAIIVFVFPKLEKLAYGFGCGIYYGGALLSVILNTIDTKDHLVSGFLCAILICVIVYYFTMEKK